MSQYCCHFTCTLLSERCPFEENPGEIPEENKGTKTVPNGVCSVIQMVTGGLDCPQFLLVYLLSVFCFLTSQCNL